MKEKIRQLLRKEPMKLTPYQERLCRLRCEHFLSEAEIAKLLGRSHQTIKNDFVKLRVALRVQTFDSAWREYKKAQAAPGTSTATDSQDKSNESSGLELDKPPAAVL